MIISIVETSSSSSSSTRTTSISSIPPPSTFPFGPMSSRMCFKHCHCKADNFEQAAKALVTAISSRWTLRDTNSWKFERFRWISILCIATYKSIPRADCLVFHAIEDMLSRIIPEQGRCADHFIRLAPSFEVLLVTTGLQQRTHGLGLLSRVKDAIVEILLQKAQGFCWVLGFTESIDLTGETELRGF
nr:hypothetical protein Iba_chr03cCG7210 [Ipomoea batatas]